MLHQESYKVIKGLVNGGHVRKKKLHIYRYYLFSFEACFFHVLVTNLVG